MKEVIWKAIKISLGLKMKFSHPNQSLASNLFERLFWTPQNEIYHILQSSQSKIHYCIRFIVSLKCRYILKMTSNLQSWYLLHSLSFFENLSRFQVMVSGKLNTVLWDMAGSGIKITYILNLIYEINQTFKTFLQTESM